MREFRECPVTRRMRIHNTPAKRWTYTRGTGIRRILDVLERNISASPALRFRFVPTEFEIMKFLNSVRDNLRRNVEELITDYVVMIRFDFGRYLIKQLLCIDISSHTLFSDMQRRRARDSSRSKYR